MSSNLATLKYIHVHWCQSLAAHSCSTTAEPVFLHWIKICRFGNRITLQMESESIMTKRLDEWTSQPPTSFSVLNSNRLQNKQLVRWYPSPSFNLKSPRWPTARRLWSLCQMTAQHLLARFVAHVSHLWLDATYDFIWHHLMLMASKGLCAADQSGKRKRKGGFRCCCKGF